MSSYVSIKISPTKYKHFKVDEEVKTYIMQLENAINNEEVKNVLKELYPRLNQNKEDDTSNNGSNNNSIPNMEV